MITVVKMGKPLRPNAVQRRIDRTTILGNPYVIGRDGTREEVIAKYRADAKGFTGYWTEERKAALTELHAIVCDNLGEPPRDLELVCWCAPEPCHGDVLKELLEEMECTKEYD